MRLSFLRSVESRLRKARLKAQDKRHKQGASVKGQEKFEV